MISNGINSKKMLWVDDDPKERFEYEEEILTKIYSWEIDWKSTIKDAAEILTKENFDIILLDQMFPWGSNLHAPDVWSGCKLLYWLRGTKFTVKSCPWPWDDDARTLEKHLGTPLDSNRELPVIVLSAYADVDIENAIRQASPLDKRIPLLSKPVDIAEFRMHLGLEQ